MPVAATTEGSTASQTVSNQLATLVPTFDPSKDDLEQYTQKVELLTEVWPAGKFNELITRLILGTTGTAFSKLQLKRSALMTGDSKGVQELVKLLGGHWGKVNLEKRYEAAERALFRLQQKSDESNDSFLEFTCTGLADRVIGAENRCGTKQYPVAAVQHVAQSS